MTYRTSISEDAALSLPITSQSVQFAQQFAREQPSPEKREQVGLNTLAVCVVNDYLHMLEFPTRPEIGESWNPVTRMTADVADLNIVGIGTIECRPLRRGQTTCQIPPETWHDRIGYVIVQLDLEAREATLLGYLPQASAIVSIDRLRPIEDLIDQIHQFSTAPVSRVTQLNQWLQGRITEGWQTVESLIYTPDFAFRTSEIVGSAQGAKRINFGVDLFETSVALVVDLLPDPTTDRTHIRLQVHPTQQPYLPPNIQLVVLDDKGTTFSEAQSRDRDNYIQLSFNGTVGETFAAQIRLGEAQVIEPFSL